MQDTREVRDVSLNKELKIRLCLMDPYDKHTHWETATVLLGLNLNFVKSLAFKLCCNFKM